jgi:hypothetical protein
MKNFSSSSRFLALLDDAHDGIAGLAAGRFVDFREHLFEPRDVLFGSPF